MKVDLQEFEKFLIDKMQETLLPSVAVAAVENGDVVFSKGFGFRDKDAGLAASPRTLYGIGSVTKSFTCLAVEKLQEEGKLKTSDLVREYLPSGFNVFQDGVTIHHLMTHSSGLPGLGYAEALLGGLLGYGDDWLPISNAEDLMTFMKDSREWNVAKPGERFYYLNEGYAILGYIISKVSGTPYDEYLKKRIFEPLGMKRTFFLKKDVESEPDRATPYFKQNKKLNASFYPYGIYSDGGIVSNAIDLSNYIMMFLGKGSFEGRSVVSEESIVRMETPYIKYPTGVFGDESYGYGLLIAPNFYGRKLLQHDGSVGVFTACIGFIPETNCGVALLTNASGYPPGDLAKCALACLLGEDPSKLSFVKHEAYLKKLEGRYDTYKGSYRAEVRRSGDFLILKILNRVEESEIILVPENLERETAIFHTSINKRRYQVEFRIRNEGIELIFERYKFRKLQG